MEAAGEGGLRSFELADVSDSDDDDEGETLFGEAPPSYFDLVPSPEIANLDRSPGPARISMYGHEDPAAAQHLPPLLPISEQSPQSQPTGSHFNTILWFSGASVHH